MNFSFILVICAVILTLLSGIVTAYTCSESKPQIYKKLEKHTIKIQWGISILLIIFTLLGVVIGVPAFTKTSVLLLFWCMVSSILFVVGSILKWFVPENYQKIYKFSAKAVVVVLMLEITVFNFNSYDFLLKDYKQAKLDLKNANILNGAVLNNDGSVQLTNGMIEFTNIAIPVGSIGVDVTNTTLAQTDLQISYSDETNINYRSPITMSVIEGNQRSSTIPCAFSGKVSKLMFSYSGGEENPIILKEISLNNDITPDIDPLRIFTILFLTIFSYVLINIGCFKRPLKESAVNIKICTLVLSFIFVFFAFALITTNYNLDISKDFSMETGNQITKELVDAFEQGKVELDIPVDDSLKNLDNPYDWSERTSKNVTYSWDHVYYNGNYYSYYGIAPVILLFLPYHLITGFYFPTVWGVMLFGGIGIVFLIKLLNNIFKRYFPEISFGFLVIADIITLFSCSVWFNFVTPNFYEISQTSGFAFITIGGYMLISSNVLEKGNKIILWRLALSSIFLALAVLCRPTLAVYCIVSLIFVAFGFVNLKKSLQSDKSKKLSYTKYFICSLLPFVMIGGIQMIYNYMRFGSFFDFGIDYSLTINDFTRAESHISQILIGFVNFLFVFPIIDTVFPFVHSNFATLNTNGYYFIANSVACGIILRALPTLSYVFAGKAYRLAPKSERKWNTAIIISGCLIAPFMIIWSIAESGYGVRYATDFAWQIILGAFIIAFTIYSSIRNKGVKKILTSVLIFAMIISIIINFAQVYEYQLNNSSVETKEFLLGVARSFEFWR